MILGIYFVNRDEYLDFVQWHQVLDFVQWQQVLHFVQWNLLHLVEEDEVPQILFQKIL